MLLVSSFGINFVIARNLLSGSLTSLHTVGNLRSQTSRPSTVAWDKLRSPKTVGMTTNIPSGQASPALVNALFERVEEQGEVRNYNFLYLT